MRGDVGKIKGMKRGEERWRESGIWPWAQVFS